MDRSTCNHAEDLLDSNEYNPLNPIEYGEIIAVGEQDSLVAGQAETPWGTWWDLLHAYPHE